MKPAFDLLDLAPVKEWLRAPVPTYWLLGIAAGIVAAYLYNTSMLAPATPLPKAGTAGSLGIAPLIAKVRQELAESEIMRIKQGDPPLFKVTEFDMEINFVVRSAASVEGGINVQVVTAGAEQSFASETVHKLRLHMVVPKDDTVHNVPGSTPPKQPQSTERTSSDLPRKESR